MSVGFEDEEYSNPDATGVLLWAYPPDENDGVPGEELIEVVLDISVGQYEESLKREGEWRRTGHYYIPASIVNKHTVSRRRFIPEFETL